MVSTLTREWSRHHHVVVAVFDGRITSYECGGTVIDLRLPAIKPFFKKAHRVSWERSIHLARLLRGERPDRIVSFMESANFPTIVAAAMTGLLGRLRVSVRTESVCNINSVALAPPGSVPSTGTRDRTLNRR